MSFVSRCGKPLYTEDKTYWCEAPAHIPHSIHFNGSIDFHQPLRQWSYNGTGKILINEAACLVCGEVVRSTHRHHFHQCGCGALFTDGGRDYIRRGITPDSPWEDRTIYVPRPLPKVNGSRASSMAFGWLVPHPLCGSCGKRFDRQPSSKDGNSKYMHHAPECPRCVNDRAIAERFMRGENV